MEVSGMNTLWIVVIAAVIIYLAYNFYAKQIDRNVIKADAKKSHTGKNVYGRCGLHAHQP
jgi:carbon starvation protein CstA